MKVNSISLVGRRDLVARVVNDISNKTLQISCLPKAEDTKRNRKISFLYRVEF